jgi:hypothetical protein
MKLWLDDIRPAPDGWVHVKTATDAYELIKTGVVEVASLDHDLGEAHTGYDLCKWMAESGIWPKTKPRVHSANPVGREAMEWTIHRYFKTGGA